MNCWSSASAPTKPDPEGVEVGFWSEFLKRAGAFARVRICDLRAVLLSPGAFGEALCFWGWQASFFCPEDQYGATKNFYNPSVHPINAHKCCLRLLTYIQVVQLRYVTVVLCCRYYADCAKYPVVRELAIGTVITYSHACCRSPKQALQRQSVKSKAAAAAVLTLCF